MYNRNGIARSADVMKMEMLSILPVLCEGNTSPLEEPWCRALLFSLISTWQVVGRMVEFGGDLKTMTLIESSVVLYSAKFLT